MAETLEPFPVKSDAEVMRAELNRKHAYGAYAVNASETADSSSSVGETYEGTD